MALLGWNKLEVSYPTSNVNMKAGMRGSVVVVSSVVKISAVIRHPKYKLPRSYYDIALAKLTRPITVFGLSTISWRSHHSYWMGANRIWWRAIV
ncbi:unnamed protein product [Leptidea sinapis]|uniref:Uncharacterized protein n=1 Tax=Leptidea sinapis TaxID=189913 RepID=A0A5E4PRD2_9NEOP|nr:unnamed protein product [Leptidea sinapis]